MPTKKTIKDLYSEIRKNLFFMIPENWESIYLYASVIQRDNGEETGEMFFYYFPKSIIRKNPVNVYQIPQKFNLDEKEYERLAKELYELIKKLRHQCQKYDQINWSNITISIENVEFLAEYNCDDLMYSRYSSEERIAIWQYKYLKYPIERFTKNVRNAIIEYLEEEKQELHRSLTYTETFYEQHEHNNIQYNISKNTDKYIKVDNETKDFEIIKDDCYKIHSNSIFKRKNNKMLSKKDNNSTIDDEKEIVVRNQILKY